MGIGVGKCVGVWGEEGELWEELWEEVRYEMKCRKVCWGVGQCSL